jgi:hypothetical protein
VTGRRCGSGAGGESGAGAGRCVRGCRRSEYERQRELNLQAKPSAQRWRCRTRGEHGVGRQHRTTGSQPPTRVHARNAAQRAQPRVRQRRNVQSVQTERTRRAGSEWAEVEATSGAKWLARGQGVKTVGFSGGSGPGLEWRRPPNSLTSLPFSAWTFRHFPFPRSSSRTHAHSLLSLLSPTHQACCLLRSSSSARNLCRISRDSSTSCALCSSTLFSWLGRRAPAVRPHLCLLQPR